MVQEIQKLSGRGKKVCPNCSTVTGPRAFTCGNCNYNFFPDKESKVKYVPQGLTRGQKKCPSCDEVNAARQIQCKCGFHFQEKKVVDVVITSTPVRKEVEVREIDWMTLTKGDIIEVLSGAGDHYIGESGKTYMADFGEYTVVDVKPTGILATEYNGHGTAFINMIDNAPSISSMIKREKHLIKMVQKASIPTLGIS